MISFYPTKYYQHFGLSDAILPQVPTRASHTMTMAACLRGAPVVWNLRAAFPQWPWNKFRVRFVEWWLYNVGFVPVIEELARYLYSYIWTNYSCTFTENYDSVWKFTFFVHPRFLEWRYNPVWPWRWCHDRKFLAHGFAFVRRVAHGWAGVSAMRVVWLGRCGVMEPRRGSMKLCGSFRFCTECYLFSTGNKRKLTPLSQTWT